PFGLDRRDEEVVTEEPLVGEVPDALVVGDLEAERTHERLSRGERTLGLFREIRDESFAQLREAAEARQDARVARAFGDVPRCPVTARQPMMVELGVVLHDRAEARRGGRTEIELGVGDVTREAVDADFLAQVAALLGPPAPRLRVREVRKQGAREPPATVPIRLPVVALQAIPALEHRLAVGAGLAAVRLYERDLPQQHLDAGRVPLVDHSLR